MRPAESKDVAEGRVVVGIEVDDVPPDLTDFALDAAFARGAGFDVVHAATRPELLGTGPTGALYAGHTQCRAARKRRWSSS